MEDILIPIIALLLPVFIVWIVSHYRHADKQLNMLDPGQAAELTQMSKVADMLDQRVNVLERILDDEVPGWREKNE